MFLSQFPKAILKAHWAQQRNRVEDWSNYWALVNFLQGKASNNLFLFFDRKASNKL